MTKHNRRREILEAIRQYKAANDGASPSERDIAEMVGVSRPVVNRYLAKLETAGVIARPGRGRRTIRILAEQLNLS